MKISATRIKMYLQCPRQYRYAYIERLPTTLTPQLAFGQAIHHTMRRLHSLQLERCVIPDHATSLFIFTELWGEALRQADVQFTDKTGSPETFVKLAEDIIAGYLARYGPEPLPLAVEFAFELPWRDHILCGVIDRIDADSTSLIVTDFKTGKAKPTPKELTNDLQFTVYAYAAEQIFAVPVGRMIYHHLRSGAEMGTLRGEDDFRHLLEAVLPSVVSGIESEMFPPSYGFHCNWCNFRERCFRESTQQIDVTQIAWPETLPELSELLAA